MPPGTIAVSPQVRYRSAMVAASDVPVLSFGNPLRNRRRGRAPEWKERPEPESLTGVQWPNVFDLMPKGRPISPCVTRAAWPCRPGRSIRPKNDLIEVDVNIELLAKSLGVMQPWETLAASPPTGTAFEAAWASYCEPSATPPQASKSGTCRGREPPHARHTCLGQPTAHQGCERGNYLDALVAPVIENDGVGGSNASCGTS
jgi:hypothetical protein